MEVVHISYRAMISERWFVSVTPFASTARRRTTYAPLAIIVVSTSLKTQVSETLSLVLANLHLDREYLHP
jgi:hypothetical protein